MERERTDEVPVEPRVSFEKKLENLINCESMENGSNTPDFLLAMFMKECLGSFNRATKARDIWYMGKMQEIKYEAV